MNKAELTAAIVKKTGFTKKDAEKAIAAVTDVITETLAAGDVNKRQPLSSARAIRRCAAA